MPALFEDADCALRDGFRLFESSFRNKDLCSSVIELGSAHFVSNADCQASGLHKVFVSLAVASEFVEQESEIVFDVSAIDRVVGKFEFLIGFLVLLYRLLK